MRRVIELLIVLSLLVIVGCGKSGIKDMTGDAVADTESIQEDQIAEEYERPVASKTAQTNEEKKQMCDETYDGPTKKICYRMFGVKQVIGGSIQ